MKINDYIADNPQNPQPDSLSRPCRVPTIRRQFANTRRQIADILAKNKKSHKNAKDCLTYADLWSNLVLQNNHLLSGDEIMTPLQYIAALITAAFVYLMFVFLLSF